MKRIITKKIWHCSDSDIKSHDDISVIRKWHVEERGWPDVGYHFFIKLNGEVQKGRPIHMVGAHCFGQNLYSIGICLHGKSGAFTKAQLYSAQLLNAELDDYFERKLQNFNHSDFDDKKPFCSGMDLKILEESL